MKRRIGLQLALGTVVLAGLAACGSDGDGGGTVASSDNGTLRMALTDAPTCGYDAVNVTIQKIRVNQNSSASETDSGWSEIVLNPARRVNLLTLTNGVLDELGQTPLPTGKYTQLRLILADNDSAHPMANSVVPSGGSETVLKTPSGQQSGIKTNIDISITANKLADFVLDFDACKSVVVAGSSGQYLLKPVVTVIPRYVSGVTGFVDASFVNGNTSVSVQQGGVVIKSTSPGASGQFLLQPVAPGTYTLVMTTPGRTTAIITNVAVNTDTVTPINALGTALNPPASPLGTVNGAAPVDTLVRVLQPLTAGVTVEIAGRFVDGNSGIFSYPLAVNAPLVAPYAPSPAVLAFAADTAVAGKYTLRASLTGQSDQTAVLGTLTPGATITTNLTFR